MKYVISLLFFVVTVWSLPTENDNLKQLAHSHRLFTAAAYKEIIKSHKGDLIFSPFSAEAALAMTSEGARGATRDELLQGLSLPSSQESIQKMYKEFLPKLKEDTEDLKLSTANKIYVGNSVKLEHDFEEVIKNVYSSGVEQVNFGKSQEAADTINEWVEDQTNKKIQQIINPDWLSTDTKIILVNALYLAANWAHDFKPAQTKDEKFYKTANDFEEVPTMSQTNFYQYYDNRAIGVTFLEIPFFARRLKMVIALPHEKEGLTALEAHVKKLLEPQPTVMERVHVKIPKAAITSEIDLIPVLQALGVQKIFGGEDADLSGLSSNEKNIFVSHVVQKAFINVTETGVEAAAATAVVGENRSIRVLTTPLKEFHADHPFFFSIQKDGVILFAGRVNLKV